MGDLTLDRVVRSLSSEKQRGRSDALADLKHILQQNKHSSKLTTLGDKACYKIFDSLFRFIAVEKLAYYRAQRSNSKGPSASRLSACASVIRTAVDVFLRNLRTKSVRAIVCHVTDTLPVPGEGLWEPLSVDYTKSLAALLQYPPHVEHLGDDEWGALMKFCLRCLGPKEDDDSQLSGRHARRSTLDDYLDPDSGPSTPSRTKPTLTIRERHLGDNSVIEEILVCIQLLTASPNAPVQAHARKILHGLAEFVKSAPVAGSAHQAAFHSINTVVTKALFDHSTLVRASLLDLIPVIRRLWATKLAGLKDELLVTTLFCTIILCDVTRREPSESLADMVEGLMDSLYSEYTRRPEKEILQLDELVFYQRGLTQLGKPIIRPRLGNAKSEHNWTIIWAIARLLQLAEEIATQLSVSQAPSEAPYKRQRFTSAIDDIFRDSFSSSGMRRVCALQLIPFLLGDQISLDSKTSLLQRLIPNIADDSPSLSSWTMLAIASIASMPDAKTPSLIQCWQRAWEITSRASTSHLTSRAACTLMSTILQFDLLEYSVFAETSRSMLSSINLNGPTTISDSSLGFWATITRMSAQINPGSIMGASRQICGWLREVWTIGTVTDRIQTAQVAAFAHPLDLLNLLLACTNRGLSLPDHRFSGPTGLIAKNWHFCHRNRRLLVYLFHVEGMVESVNPWDAEDSFTIEQSTRADPNDAIILDLLQTKSEVFLQAWEAMSENKSHHITVDILQILCSFCIVAALYVECLPQQFAPRLQTLQDHSQQLWRKICSFLAGRERDFCHVVLELISPVLASAACFFDSDCAVSKSLCGLVSPLADVLENCRQRQIEYLSTDIEERMDLDDPLSMHNEKLDFHEPIITLNREALPLFHDDATFQRCMTVQLSIFHKSHTGRYRSDQPDHETLVEYLTGLEETDILSAQAVLHQVYLACSHMERHLLLSVLEDLGEKCLQSYGLERCESSHSLCIRMMDSFVASWTSEERDHLNDSASDIYTWFTDVLLTNQMASSRVYISLARLLDHVLEYNSNYPGDQSSPSPRTCLFTILQQGGLLVKFSAADLIPQLFGRFPLKDHDAIFNDVLENLPRDTDWIEGIALRLFVLGQLASRWHTLLRKSIYHMFETPAQVPHSLWYAEKCLQSVAKALGLGNPKELFRLFSSQILYTWTETQSVKLMPFRMFGYATLRDLLNDVQDEIVGQMVMRGEEHEISELSSCVNTRFVELLSASFYTAEAYSIARDISTPPSQGSQPKGAENRLKRILGGESFVNLLDRQFPLVIATFFKSLDQYDQIERAFAKRSSFQGTLGILRDITGRSASNVALPANQQPSFRSRYLLDELEFLCKRTGYELGTIWTPTLASFVCRTLLESIHPALGSLHACSVIRKIRILVSVAGQVMLRDYPFEMILHALRPFLTDVYCSEDALGIFWYLLEAGSAYLDESPAFMAGIAVSTFVSLRNFLLSSSEYTTQESQLTTVVPNTERFLCWFGDLIDNYTSPALSTEAQVSFRRLMRASQKVSTAECALKEVSERDLLVEVLGDRSCDHGLLSRPISDHVISLLCSSFKRPPDIHGDIPGKDEGVPAETVTIFQTLDNFDPGTDYRLWAAKVMGRAFAATGSISDVLLREQDTSLFNSSDPESPSAVFNHSKVNVLQVLCSMLQNDDRQEVGLVERTLQVIVSNLASYPEFESCASAVPSSLMNALVWSPYNCPVEGLASPGARAGYDAVRWDPSLPSADWARRLALFLSTAACEDPVIGPLARILKTIPGLAERLLPYIIHDVLLAETQGTEDARQNVSDIFKQALHDVNEHTISHARLVINCILYLRNQPLPDETTIVERDEWLDVDYGEASSAANKCRLPKTSLLFLEIHSSRMDDKSRRSSATKYCPQPDTLHDVFKSIDDPDLFYGVQRESSFNSVMERLEYESSGFKNLLFQSAQYDSEIQLSRDANMYGVVKALNSTNLQGIANSMFSAPGEKDTSGSFDSMLHAASSLRQWDIPVSPLNHSPSAIVFRAFQCLNTSSTISEASASVDECLLTALNVLGDSGGSSTFLRTTMKALGIMTEISDVFSATSLESLDQEWQKIKARNSWLKSASFHEVGEIINWQEALFSSIKQKEYLKSAIGISDSDAQLLEAKVIRQSLDITRSHEIPQASLKSAICLSKLSGICSSLGINIEGAAKFDLANVLWDQGEMTTSIGMLQQLNDQNDLHKQTIPISPAELLVTLGHNVAEARLEKPEVIVQEYLGPAVKELKGSSAGHEAGRVYHGFAMFCDQQLQNPDGLEDFRRAEQLRDRKESEMRALEEMMQNAHGKEKDSLKLFRSKAKQWFDLDDREYQRLRRSREGFLQQCLENYLLCLKESDAYNNDALRFCAIWLDKSDSDIANSAVSKYLHQVPSRKFASLMNQLSSRLLNVPDNFQKLLFALIFRICCDHPFHGMYQIFASSKSKGGKDQSSLARQRAASKLVEKLKSDDRIGLTWIAVHNTNINYVRFAVDKPDEKLRSGSKVLLRKLVTGQRLEQDEVMQKLPPPTMKVELRVDCDYSGVPKLAHFQPEFTIASGVSAPKIVTAVGSDGQRYKQLFKGGNDDLRQDAIMEQVFEQVSSLLKDHQSTRQRNLGIRTYKVLPLTSNAGIIEFVPNTIPLHEYLLPAHQTYYPKDMKPNACRKHIGDVQTRSFEQRVRTYRHVAEHFRPVLRYFFMEKYNNPDDWFSKRLSYTRSTAAISVLGHVLGLGDRHGHNILLDERTGEVVHIDLGVAFEQGRVLPVPEVVPFRLTRDLVDGMGITKTEGVFRRCCEFTLEALRQESYSIMTILDVLRYDPLYSWTVSPLRMKRIQDPQVAGDGPPALPGAADKGSTNEPSEADRALTVVAKKLSKTLSVTATVNELIQQATDEKNLAVLYCGWAAYA